MAWLLLLIAGILEVSWVAILKFSDPFHKPYLFFPLILILASIPLLLSVVFRSIPIGTAYSIWVGTGILGTTLVGIFIFGDAINPLRIIFILLLLFSIIGLKITGS